MSRRDAIERLNRLRRSDKPMTEGLTAFRVDGPPAAPKDFATVTVPGIEKTGLRCERWPDCGCGDDCPDVDDADAPRLTWLFRALLLATAALGFGLMIWSYRQ